MFRRHGDHAMSDGFKREQMTEPGNLIYRIADLDGKVIAECFSAAAASREFTWRGLSGSNRATVSTITRRAWGDYDPGGARSNRYMGPWPQAKLDDLKRFYEQGKLWRWIEEYFEASQYSLQRKLREAGVIKRMSPEHPRNREGGHRCLWLTQNEKLLQMFHADIPIGVMSSELNRTEGAIWTHLIIIGAIKRKMQAHALGWYGDGGFATPIGNETAGYWHSVFMEDDEVPRQRSDILALVDKLHPRVRRLVSAVIDGDDLKSAARIAGLTDRHLEIVMPPLRCLLASYLELRA